MYVSTRCQTTTCSYNWKGLSYSIVIIIHTTFEVLHTYVHVLLLNGNTCTYMYVHNTDTHIHKHTQQLHVHVHVHVYIITPPTQSRVNNVHVHVCLYTHRNMYKCNRNIYMYIAHVNYYTCIDAWTLWCAVPRKKCTNPALCVGSVVHLKDTAKLPSRLIQVGGVRGCR